MKAIDQIKKLKNPYYLVWLIIRIWLGLAAGVMGIFSFESSGVVNTFLWILLGAQFLIDGDLIKQSFKCNRFYIVIGLVILILITT